MTVRDFLDVYYGLLRVYYFDNIAGRGFDLIGPINNDETIPDHILDLIICYIHPAESFRGVQICVKSPSSLLGQKEAM